MTVKPAGTPKHGQKTDAREIVARILAAHGEDHGAFIAVLEEIQREYGYLPEEALRAVADQTRGSLVDVYAVATFYKSFRLQPRGRHLLCACLGTACHVRGAPAVVEEIERQLGIQAKETTPDGEFTLDTVNCLGACALGPIVVADGRYFLNVTPARIRGILKDVRAGFAKAGPSAGTTPAG